MKHLWVLYILFNFSIFSQDIESVIQDDFEQNTEARLINPFNGREFSQYQTYELINDVLNQKNSDDLKDSYRSLIEQIKNSNPNLKDEMLNYNFAISIPNHITKNSPYTNDALEFINEELSNNQDEWTQSTLLAQVSLVKLKDDPNNIQSLTQNELENLLKRSTQEMDYDLLSSVYEQMNGNGEILDEVQGLLIFKAIEQDLDQDAFDKIVATGKNKGQDIESTACSILDAQLEMISYDAYEYSEDRDNPELSEEDNQYNIDMIAGMINSLSSHGVNLNTICASGKTIEEMISNSEFVSLDEVKSNFNPVEQVDITCDTQLPSMTTKDLFSGCDVDKIVWLLEKLENKKTKENVVYITGEGIGSCDVILETRKRKKIDMTNLRIVNKNGAEREIYATPKQLINLLTK